MRFKINVLLISFILFAGNLYAVDGTQSVTEIRQNEHWKVIEFSAPKQMIYRISSVSINNLRSFLTFDFLPSNRCVPDAAVMVTEFERYNNTFDNGILPISYKIPGVKEETELVKTHMSPGDKFAFYQFGKMRVESLIKSNDKGKMAVWIPGSADGVVKRSENIYFSLSGFSESLKSASALCNDNR